MKTSTSSTHAKWFALTLGLALPAGLTLIARRFTRWGHESPRYKVKLKHGPFEIRHYPPVPVVSTPMPALFQVEKNKGFRRLFGYISGDNARQTQIAMTTPVLVGLQERSKMSFVLPEEVVDAGPPASTRDDVELETREGGQFAAYRFSGNPNRERTDAAQEALARCLAAEGLQPAGAAQLATYDSPYTPSFLRRNEVLIPVRPAT